MTLNAEVVPAHSPKSSDSAPSVTDAASGGHANILAGYVKQTDFASTHGISTRTSKRYRALGMPWLIWGGEIYIHLEGASTWLKSRVRRNNQRRAA
jgi:hypothetical protein